MQFVALVGCQKRLVVCLEVLRIEIRFLRLKSCARKRLAVVVLINFVKYGAFLHNFEPLK